MNKRILFLFLALTFFTWAVTFYINRVTIPKDLKKFVLNESQQFLGRKVHIKHMSFNPINGFSLEGITILERDSPEIFASIDRVHVHLLYWPFLRQQKIVISSLELKGAAINLIRYKPGEWNFSDILRRRSGRAVKPLYLSRVIISDGYARLTNLEDGMQFSEVFDPVDATVELSLTKGIVFETAVHYANKHRTLQINGYTQPLKEHLSARVISNGISLKRYLNLFDVKLPFTLNDAVLQSVDSQISLRNNVFDMTGAVSLEDVDVADQHSRLLLRTLAMHDVNFSSHDEEYALKGRISSEGLKMTSGEASWAADILSAHVHELRLHPASVNFTGSLNAVHAAITHGSRWSFSGDVQLNSLGLSRGANALSLSAGTDIKNAALSIGETIRLKGDFLSPGVMVINTSGTTTAKGDLYANNLFYSWPTDKELHTQAAFTDIRVVANPETQWTVKSDVRFTGLHLKLPRGKTLTSEVEGPVAFEFEPKDKNFKISSTYRLSNGTFMLSDSMTLSGSPSGTVVVLSKKPGETDLPYSGSMEFNDAVLSGTNLGSIDNIHGTVMFQNNLARSNNLNLQVLGMPALLTGKLEDFLAPMLDVTVHVKDFDLAKTQEIIPGIIKTNDLHLSGTAPWLSVSYQGSVSTTKDAEISFEAQVTDAAITSGTIGQTLTGVTAGVRYQDQQLSWQELRAQFNGRDYRSTGVLFPSAQPTVETEIEAERLKIKTRFQYAQDQMIFQQLIGHYKNAVFNLKGSMGHMPGGGTMLDLTGEADLELKDLPVLFPELPDGIKECGLAGMTHLKGSFKGDPSHWQDWQFDLTGASPQFTVRGLNVQNMKFNAVQKDNLLKPFHVWGEFYGGDLNVVASLDTAKKELPYELVVRVLDSDLDKLRLDTPLEKYLLKGIFSTTAILNGQLTDHKSINGKGGIEVKDGMLWELDLLKGLGGILLIPEYKDIVFTQAGMNFTVANGLISTDNLQLLGPSLDLFGRGTLDLNKDQALDLVLNPDFDTSVIVGSSSIKKGTTAIITGTERFMSVEVTGTLTKPKYRVNNAPVKILQKTGGVILENVSQFFQNIF